MGSGTTPEFPRQLSSACVCDTRYVARGKEFEMFRDTVASAGHRWLIDKNPEREFEGRFVGFDSDDVSVAWLSAVPITATRTAAEISTESDLLTVSLVLSGNAHVKQAGEVVSGNLGDILIFDHALPVRVIEAADDHYEVLSIYYPKALFSDANEKDFLFRNQAFKQPQIFPPLASCFRALKDALLTGFPNEISALHCAIGSLLPIGAEPVGGRHTSLEVALSSVKSGREVMELVRDNLSNAELSPALIADHVGFSLRWLHRLFAARGTTFSSYVADKRLEQIARDLVRINNGRVPIATIAYRWGFREMSTFERAFKKKFGCTPRAYRCKS